MSKILKLASDTMLYGMGSIVPRVLNFLLFPLHTRVFNPEEYGIISYLYAFAAFFNIVYTFGIETAYFRYATREGYNARRVFNVAQTVLVGISLTLSTFIILFAQPIAAGLSIPGKSSYIIWLAIIMGIDGVVALPFAKLRLERKPIPFITAKIANVLILVGLNVYFFIVNGWLYRNEIKFDFQSLIGGSISVHGYGIEYVFIANLIANGFYILFFLKTFIRWKPSWDRIIVPSMIRYAYPVMLTGLAGITNEMFSRWALEWWLPDNFYPGKSSMYALGVFSVAYKYAIIMSLAIQAFRFAAEPFFFSHAENKSSPELFAKVNHLFLIVMSFIFLVVVTQIDTLKFLAGGEEYYEGLVAVPMLLCGYLFLGIYYNLSVWFKVTDKTYYGTLFTLGGALITVVFNFIFIPIWGYIGSSWASTICYFCMAAACYITGQKHYPIPYKVFAGLGYFLFALALVVLSYWFVFEDPRLNFVFRTTLPLMFIVVAYRVERKIFRVS